MTQRLLDRPTLFGGPPPMPPANRRDYRLGRAPLSALLVALPVSAALWALLALLVYLAVR